MTAKDLLNKILDYNYLWSSPVRKDSKPAIVRLSQIDALQEAFGLTKKYVNPSFQSEYSLGGRPPIKRGQYLEKLTNLEYLLKGEFLKDREFEKNKELCDRVIVKMLELDPGAEYFILQKPVAIGWLFNNLLRFRQDVYKVTYPNEGMMEGYSAGLYYSFYLQAQLQEIITNNLSEIDETLCLILDPAKRDFDKNEINYPEADLDSIDREWAIENY